ncbi:MAG: 2-C-methyl-D-erythritol 4-phosphate cytidylyltransferase [Planctomycetota bacterium]
MSRKANFTGKDTDFTAVIPAAGRGARMNSRVRKPLLSLDDTPIVLHTLARFAALDCCRKIVLIVHPDDSGFYAECWQRPLEDHFGPLDIVPGGSSRQESVRRGLEGASSDIVLIHDAVRPLVRFDIIKTVACRAGIDGAAIAAVPAIATIKEVDRDRCIRATPSRDGLWMAQTPQGFRRDGILNAHRYAERHGLSVTDDAGLMEQRGEDVFVEKDSRDNIKITTPEDMAVASALLEWQRDNGVRAASVDVPKLPLVNEE